MPDRPPTSNRGSSERTPRFDRRRLMQVLGAGAAMTAVGSGTVIGDEHDDDDDHNDYDDDHETETDSNGTDAGIHPTFGFAAASDEVEPRVAPDHVVEAVIVPREDREVPEFFFEPTGLAIEPGETVRFQLVSPHHSVTAYHPAMGTIQRVPDGVPPFSSPVLPVGGYWLYTFEETGVYDVHCGPHEQFGHVARLVVGEATGPGAEPVLGPEAAESEEADHDHDDENAAESESEDGGGPPANGEPMLRPPVGAALTVLSDPALEPERILEQGSVSWDEIDNVNKEIGP